jgi:NADH-quinone oxidoreductase subunit L
VINWFPTGDTWFQIGVWVDPLTVATLFFVAWTILMIFIYSVGYQNYGQPKGDHDVPGLPPHGATEKDEHGHEHRVPSIEPMYSRFFAFLALFSFGMYVLVVSNNLLTLFVGWEIMGLCSYLLTLFVGWEIMGLCSYLLIGFWYAKPSARAAAIKAFLTTRVADVIMLLGLAYLYYLAGSLSYDVIFSEETLHLLTETGTPFLGLSAAVVIGIFLFIGTIGKSAQWPLHVWLPDAMEGPTPVSAMIHAATMVSAGVYLVIRVFPIISAGAVHGEPTVTMNIMAFIGAFTGLFAATIAVTQNDIKRVLAYSTISQLGYMIAAIGIGAYVAAAFHLFTHAFFKALLFLGSGSVIHGVEHGVLHTDEHVDPQDMFNMGGLRKKMPLTFWTFLIGGLALSGFPLLTAGFWSKDEILADAFAQSNWAVFITLAFAALLTAFYTMRQITLTFLGQPRTEASKHAVESKWTMTLPLVGLAVFAIGAGWLGITNDFPIIGGLLPNYMHDFVGETLAEHPEAIRFNWIPLLTSLAVAFGGLFLGWLVYRNVSAGEADPLEKPLGPVYSLLKNKYYFDELYDFIFVRPAYWISRTFTYLWLDRRIIDGFLHGVARVAYSLGGLFRNYIDRPIVNGFGDFVGESVKRIGRGARFIQTGRIQQYMVMALVIAFGTLFYYLFFLAQP